MENKIIASGGGHLKWKVYQKDCKHILELYSEEEWKDEDGYKYYIMDSPWKDYFYDTVIHHIGIPVLQESPFIDGINNIKQVYLGKRNCYYDILFKNGKNIKDVVILNGVSSISMEQFYDCDSIETITIPKTIKYIGTRAFSGCDNLRAVYIEDLEAWMNISFEFSNPLIQAHNLYLNDNLVEEAIFPDEMNQIGKWVFYGCTSLKKVVIPNSVTYINSCAFDGCINLKEIVISEGVKVIDSYAFSNCCSLEHIVFPGSLESINSSAFRDCTFLKTVTFLGKIPKMAENVFAGCDKIEKYITNSLTTNNFNELLTIDHLCDNHCELKCKKLCAMFRASVDSFNFSKCSSVSLKMGKDALGRTLTFKLICNDGKVWSESSRPYREYDEYEYVCYIPDDISDEEAFEYAYSHKEKWVCFKFTEKDYNI